MALQHGKTLDPHWLPTLLWQATATGIRVGSFSWGALATIPFGRSELLRPPGPWGPGPTLLTPPGKVNGMCSPKDPPSPPGLCSHHPRHPREGPGPASLAPSRFSRDLPSTTAEAPVLTPSTPAPSLQTPTGQGATDHPLLFERQHSSFTRARPPCLLFLTCQILSAVPEKCLSLHPLFPLPLCSPPASQTRFSLFPELHAPHPTNPPSPTPSKVQPEPRTPLSKGPLLQLYYMDPPQPASEAILGYISCLISQLPRGGLCTWVTRKTRCAQTHPAHSSFQAFPSAFPAAATLGGSEPPS